MQKLGLMYLQIPEDSNTDHTVSNIIQVANFQMRDSKDSEKVFLTNDDIKSVSSVYNTTESGTTVYLKFEFTKHGTEVLKDISSNEYAKKEETEEANDEEAEETEIDENAVDAEAEVSTQEPISEQNEENNADASETEEIKDEAQTDESTQKEITLSIDNNSMITTSFDEPMENGAINLSMNSASKDNDEINETLRSTSTIATLLNSGKMPLTYKISENRYVSSDISANTIKNVIFAGIVMIAIMVIYLIFKYKFRGLLASIAYIGFIALYLLLIRYTNVLVGIASIAGIVVVMAINLAVVLSLLKITEKDEEKKKKLYKQKLINIITQLVPIFLTIIVFSFTKWNEITIFGMFMFWGIILTIVYNFLLTKDMLD